MEHTAFRKTPPAVPAASELTGSLAGALLRAPLALFDLLASWQRQVEERAHLRKLTDDQLHDIGLTRDAVDSMAAKAVWERRI